MPVSKRTRKQQTRLTFNPLPSSSPATKGYNQQVKDRAAAVGYDGSPGPAKRRKLRDTATRGDRDNIESAQFDGVNADLPTPAATLRSSKPHGDTDDTKSSEPVQARKSGTTTRQQSTARNRRDKQQQLDFSGTRDADTFSSPVKLSSSAQPHSSARSGIFSSPSRTRGKKRKAVVDISSDESVASDLPSPDELARSNSKAARAMARTQKASGRATQSSRRAVVESESDDNVVVSGGKEPGLGPGEDEESEDDMPTTLGRQPRKRVRRNSVDDFISSSPPRALQSDVDLEIIEPPGDLTRSRNDGYEDDAESEEDEDEDDAPVTPRRRILKRPRQMSRREQADLNEDLDFLAPSSDAENSARAPRNTQTAEKNKRRQALERLKRKRSSQSQPQPQSREEGEDIEVQSEDNDDNVASDEDQDDVYDDSSDGDTPQITSSRQMFNATEDDEQFIDEDEADGSLLGVPDGLPLKYTRYASMKSKELFKFAVEWMVQKKINPAFQMDDEIYDLTFRKLSDEVSGLAQSKFVSAAWKPEFTMALRARPDMANLELDRSTGDAFFRDKCEACNRANHVPTWQIQFLGKPYHPETLDEVGRNDDDDDDDAESSDESSADANEDNAQDKYTYDHQGRQILPESTLFYVGRFCMSNAETAHNLSHWRYHLNDWVVTWLIAQGYNTSEKIVQRDTWSTKKRRKYANKIVDRMEQEGVVAKLWRSFRDNLDEARSSKQGRFEARSP